MKKLLALVLALVMTMSLVTISNAATFDDDASIDYKEAVEVLAAVGILAGDGTGNVNPDAVLTRAAAAKLVTYLMVGADAAEGLVATGAKFSDVPASHWGAGYIEYLASEGIVAGVGDGKFNPDGEVTALQLAKMLLVTLNFDPALEKLVGADWAISTSKLAYEKDLFDGNDGIKVNATATREEAALYVLNTLLAKYVYYADKGTTVIAGTELSVTTGASDWVNHPDGKALYQKIFKGDLKLNVTTNKHGNPANNWKFKALNIGDFARTPVVTFTTEFNPNELLDAVEAAGYAFDTKDDAYNVGITKMVNGKQTAYYGPTATKALLETDAKTDYSWSGKGVKVDVFANSDDMIDYIVVTNTVVAEVETKAYDKASTAAVDEAALKFSIGGNVYTADAENTDGFADVFAAVEEEDLVMVVTNDYDNAGILSVYVPTVVTGDITYYSNANGKITVGGTTYSYAKSNTLSIGDTAEDVELYVDQYGYAVACDATDADAEAVIILDIYSGLNADGKIVTMAYVVYADGTTDRLECASNYAARGNVGTIKMYEMNDDDKFVIKGDAPSAGAEVTSADKGKTYSVIANIAEGSKSVKLHTKSTFLASGAKVIYAKEVDGVQKFSVSDKLDAVTLSGSVAAAAVVDADGNVSTVFVVGQSASNTVKDSSALIFIAGKNGDSKAPNANGKMVDVDVYDAFIDGVYVENFISDDEGKTLGFYENAYDTANGWYDLDTRYVPAVTDDIQVGSVASLEKDDIISEKYIVLDDSTEVELTSATKYADNLVDDDVASKSDLKLLIAEQGTANNASATIHVLYDLDTKAVLYVYVTAATAAADL